MLKRYLRKFSYFFQAISFSLRSQPLQLIVSSIIALILSRWFTFTKTVENIFWKVFDFRVPIKDWLKPGSSSFSDICYYCHQSYLLQELTVVGVRTFIPTLIYNKRIFRCINYLTFQHTRKATTALSLIWRDCDCVKFFFLVK